MINVNASGASPADAAALNDEIAALQKSVADAGNGFQFGGLSALGLTINRVFKQPVAVAYEGILFDVGDARQIAALRAMCASLPADPGAAGGGGSGTAGGTGSAVGAGTAGASGPTR